MAYTGNKPGLPTGNSIYGEGSPLENHERITVDSLGNVTGTAFTGTEFTGTEFTGTAFTGTSFTGQLRSITTTTNPTITDNPEGGKGTIHINETDGSMWVLFDDTTNGNKWRNTVTGSAIQPNLPPGNPTNTGSFPASEAMENSFNFTFSGATDSDGSVTHYLVDQVSDSSLSVTVAEVSAGSPHTFNLGTVSTDTALTFRVRAKDDDGVYSSGTIVNFTVISAVFLAATGGSIVTSGNYKIHTFTGSSTFTVTEAGNAAGSNTCEVLVIGAGGAGGGNVGGGGGAGDFIENSSLVIGAGSHTITIGAGGTGITNGNGNSGNSTTIGSLVTAIGGGGGGNANNNGKNGGSGGAGGGGNGSNRTGGIATGVGFGNNGGSVGGTYSTGGSGGGGAGAAGVDQARCQGHNGAAGRANSITGSSVTRAGGGGGGGKDNCGCSGGSGGSGGGGNGGSGCGSSGSAGQTNTGSGGGGGAEQGSTKGGTGGSGLVVIKYQFQ